MSKNIWEKWEAVPTAVRKILSNAGGGQELVIYCHPSVWPRVTGIMVDGTRYEIVQDTQCASDVVTVCPRLMIG